jgi:hypothetical protein
LTLGRVTGRLTGGTGSFGASLTGGAAGGGVGAGTVVVGGGVDTGELVVGGGMDTGELVVGGGVDTGEFAVGGAVGATTTGSRVTVTVPVLPSGLLGVLAGGFLDTGVLGEMRRVKRLGR